MTDSTTTILESSGSVGPYPDTPYETISSSSAQYKTAVAAIASVVDQFDDWERSAKVNPYIDPILSSAKNVISALQGLLGALTMPSVIGPHPLRQQRSKAISEAVQKACQGRAGLDCALQSLVANMGHSSAATGLRTELGKGIMAAFDLAKEETQSSSPTA